MSDRPGTWLTAACTPTGTGPALSDGAPRSGVAMLAAAVTVRRSEDAGSQPAQSGNAYAASPQRLVPRELRAWKPEKAGRRQKEHCQPRCRKSPAGHVHDPEEQGDKGAGVLSIIPHD